MNVEQARFNMVEQQIRPWDVLDTEVLDLLFEVKRERFVPEGCAALAFADLEIPLAHGESMMSPRMEARVVQELGVKPGDTVYEVGTGSGYLTALLAKLARHVTSAELHADLLSRAKTNLAAAGIGNVTLLEGDSARAPLGEKAYDVIVLTGSTPVLPEAFLARLNAGGRLLAVVGDAPVMKAVLVDKGVAGEVRRTELFETMLRPLVNAQAPARFRF
jgi:protein-L-isoaspartate(D-aspartate) O-methyltransferase